jgi:hypothetical protein
MHNQVLRFPGVVKDRDAGTFRKTNESEDRTGRQSEDRPGTGRKPDP